MTKSEEQYLENYDPHSYKHPNVAVDVVILTIKDNALHVLLIKRKEYPFKKAWSLIGGFVDIDTDANLLDTAKRKLKEKAGIKAPYLEQYATIGDNSRDPRGWAISTVYFALLPYESLSHLNDEQQNSMRWSRIEDSKVKEELAFDHKILLAGCLERLKNKVLYTSLPVYLMPTEFTLSELQNAYEIIMGKKIEKKSFRRRFESANILKETRKFKHSGRRPAMLYQLADDTAHIFSRTLG